MAKYTWKRLIVLTSALVALSLFATNVYAYGGGGSGGSGGSGGGSGSGSASGTTSLASIATGGTQTITNTADVADDGVVHKTTVIKSTSNEISIEIPADTKVTDKKGETYTDTISTAKVVLETALPKAVPAGVKVLRAFRVETKTGVEFSKNVSITIPLTGMVDPNKAKVWFYDTATGTYKIAGDGGVVSADGKTITVSVNHFTYFVVGSSEEVSGVKGFTDIDNHWAKNYIQELSDAGVVTGKGSGVYQPNGYLTRAEAVKIVMGALGYSTEEGAAGFGDTKGHWGASIIGTAKELGVVKGYPDGTFKPNNFISRAEVLTMLLNAKGVATSSASAKAKFPDIKQDSWYSAAVNFAVEKGIVSGYEDGTFGPGNNVTRGEMAKLAVMVKGL